jgi:DNA-binding CsgD family transcriptional regulator
MQQPFDVAAGAEDDAGSNPSDSSTLPATRSRRETPLIGRSSERASLAELFEGALDEFRAVVLHGPAGTGKTALLEEAVRLAAERKWTTLFARPAASESRLAYVTLGDLLAGAPPGALDGLSAPERRALDVALLRAEPTDEPEHRAVAAGVRSVLDTLAAEGPLLVALDDAQWLDAPSAHALEFALRRLDARPVVVLLVLRAGHALPFPLERASRRIVQIEVGPMSADELHRVIRAEVDAPLSRRQLALLRRLSSGNPHVALALARARADDSLSDVPPLPSSVGDMFLDRVSRLPTRARDELLVAALVESPEIPLVDAEVIRLAETAGLVRVGDGGAVSFTDPLLAWAIVRSATGDQRRAAHERISARSSTELGRMRHRALATVGVDEQFATELEQKAAATLAQGDPTTAAELLTHARRLTPLEAPEAWARRCTDEIDALLAAGDCEEAFALARLALDRLPPGSTRAAVLLHAAGPRPVAATLARQALLEAGMDAEVRVRAHLTVALQCLVGFDVASAEEHAEAAVTVARTTGDASLLAEALEVSAEVRFGCGAGDPAAELDEIESIVRSAGSGDGRAGPWHHVRALSLIFADETARARAILDELLADAAATGDEASEGQVRAALGVLELRAADLASAQLQLEASIDLADLSEHPLARGTRRAWLAAAQARRGDFQAARETAIEAMTIAASTGDRVSVLVGLAVLAFIAMSLGEHMEAVEYTEQIRRLLPAESDPPVWLEFEESEIESLLSVGRIEEAARRLESLLSRRDGAGYRAHIRAARATAMVLAASGSLTAAIEVLDKALEVEGPPSLPFERARTYLLKGRIERRRRRKASAREAFEQAAALFGRIDAHGWEVKARDETSRLGLRHAKGELTETERRVALLAAAGKTNREIASTLFISRRTVESNVARAYRKLGVKSRAELANHVWAQEGRVE